MKVYLATYGAYSDFEVVRVFARREDAEAYELSDDVEEFEVEEGPVETRLWHTIRWFSNEPDGEHQQTIHTGRTFTLMNPRHEHSGRRDYDGRPRHVEHRWDSESLTVGGWDIERVRKVYGELRAEWLNCKALGMVWDPNKAEWTPGEVDA
ncbi:hypothetical protein [Streptosporangium sp. G12]